MAGLQFRAEKKRNVLRFDLKELREGFCRRGTGGRPFHVQGPKTEKALEPTLSGTWNLWNGTWNLKAEPESGTTTAPAESTTETTAAPTTATTTKAAAQQQQRRRQQEQRQKRQL